MDNLGKQLYREIPEDSQMRILFVIHYCSPKTNDNAYGPMYLGTAGHEILVISSRHAKSLKGDVYSDEVEDFEGCRFYRPYAEWTDFRVRPFEKWEQVKNALDKFQPEVVIGFGEFNYKLSLKISQYYKIPYILYMEYLRFDKVASPLRGRSALKKYAPVLHDFSSRLFMKYLARHVKAVMFAYHGDKKLIPELGKLGLDAYYVPWCTDAGSFSEWPERSRKVGIYVGALEKFKSSDKLIEAIPVILEKTDTEKFIVIGPGPYAREVMKLVDVFQGRLEYIESMPRNDALRYIRSAGYGFTPVKDCGLGFIGDCWSSGTPLVAANDLDGFLEHGRDALISPTLEEMIQNINLLIRTDAEWDACHEHGMNRYEANYTGKAVGEMYLDVISRCL